MSLYKELSYDGDVDVIKGVQFSIMSAEEIELRSVAEIYKTDTYNGNDPVPHGLFDPRMGVIDHNKVCVTCDQRNTFCPGHFGHIKLEKPVFYVQYFPMVRNLLKCVCYRCSKLLIDPASEEELRGKKVSRQKRWETTYKLCQRVKRCGQFTQDGCGAKQPTITKEGMLKIAFEWKETGAASAAAAVTTPHNDRDATVTGAAAQADAAQGQGQGQGQGQAAGSTKQIITAEEALKILRRISDKDVEVLGMGKRMRPEHLICTMLPVPPPAVRPSVRNDTGQRSEDDLTHKLSMIIKVNNNLKKQVQKGAHDQVAMIAMLLQYEVATFIDNTIPGMPPSQQRTGRPIRSLTERLKGKEGRIRGNLMGKRVDFSARSVITPDPTISIDELGVPQKIAMNLTFPEVIHALNIEDMRRIVLNGPDAYPGAKYVRKTKEGRTIRLQSIDRSAASMQLELGDVVDRHLRDGDVVLFNRQPSLHKCSMMAHRVKVMPGSTFRLNVMVTPCFNADFDGDEMNMHVPQSLQTHEELQQLAAVPTQIVSQRECKPIVSVVQDIVTGLFRLTKDSTSLSEKQMANLLALNPRCTGVMPAPEVGRMWSGRQLLSTVVPPRINTHMKTGQFDENKSAAHNAQAIVSIKNGRILSGAFDKDVYQSRTKGLLHSIFNEYGPDEARRFLDNTQHIICSFLVLNGFSVGISDLVVDAATQAKFLESIKDMKTEVYKVLAQLQQGRFENKSTKSTAEAFERQVNDLLNRAVQSIGKQGAQQLDDERNRMINMIRSKAKGNNINVSQMIGCLGQQNVDGRRIADNWDHRTLPHFCKYDDGPESRGFVESSFIKGLTPQEFYFHAMGGREGIIDTAVQTSETGYIQRKLVKAMEDCKVNYDGSVRNAAGAIVQFLYGDDGMDGAKVEAQVVPYMTKEYDQFIADYDMTQEVDSMLQQRMTAHMEQLKADRQFLITHIFHGKQESSVMVPVSFFRIISMAKGDMAARVAGGDVDGGGGCTTPLAPHYVLDALDALERDMYVNKVQPGNQLFLIMARAFLSPKVVLQRHGLDKEAFDYVVGTVRQRFQDSLAHPSELVGVVAATSIGEPSTQLVLNTFHSAGIAAASKTVRGVPRLKELLGVSKKIKTPCMKVYFDEQRRGDYNVCRDLMNDIRTVRFKDLVQTVEVYFDPLDALAQDAGFVSLYRQFAEMLDDVVSVPREGEAEGAPVQPGLCAWVLRLTFDRAAMLRYHMTMIGLHTKVLDMFGSEGVSCMFSDDNAEQLVMRIKLPVKSDDDMLTDIKALEHTLMDNVVLKGTESIEQACLAKDEKRLYDAGSHQWVSTEEWVMVTEGSNMREVLCLPHVDAARTTTNNIVEIYDLLGIEAVRQALYNELAEVLDSIYVNYRHLSMLVDVQTNKGFVQSIDRHGINRGDIGPLAKCSFEETTDKLIKAGIFSEQDKINGVSANIMLGQIPPAGTGDCDVLFDPSVLMMAGDEGRQDNSAANEAKKEVQAAANSSTPKAVVLASTHKLADECTPESFRIMFRKPVIKSK